MSLAHPSKTDQPDSDLSLGLMAGSSCAGPDLGVYEVRRASVPRGRPIIWARAERKILRFPSAVAEATCGVTTTSDR